jgi:hypothetical protein
MSSKKVSERARVRRLLRERDEAKAALKDKSLENKRLFTDVATFRTDAEAALAKVEALEESIIGVRQQRDRFHLDALEWEKRCKQETAKLAEVREWADGFKPEDRISERNYSVVVGTDWKRLLAILDAPAREQTPPAESFNGVKSAVESRNAADGDYEMVEREIVLWTYKDLGLRCMYGDFVEDAGCYDASKPSSMELARATVQFRVPRKVEAQQSLAERLEAAVKGSLDVYGEDIETIIDEVRKLEQEK